VLSHWAVIPQNLLVRHQPSMAWLCILSSYDGMDASPRSRRAHPYHESRVHRCADQRCCRSRLTVDRQVMCSSLAGGSGLTSSRESPFHGVQHKQEPAERAAWRGEIQVVANPHERHASLQVGGVTWARRPRADAGREDVPQFADRR
jgi:hypothetical protein